ncbi:MAG: sialate O-acetylesterase [Candidatus Hydrogenedentes bacterium]|nr:sialate O-acetylesterase [Candidatus Hydrogenedentota bacterium]
MTKRWIRLTMGLFFWTLALQPAFAGLALPSLFTDHMLLQMRTPLLVWGTATPGETVEVALFDIKKSGKADASGTWSVTLPPLEARADAGTLTITSGQDTKTIHDVLLGEVWVCSGQSNMQWGVNRALNPEEEIAAANHPNLRLFQVPRLTADTPQTAIDAQWQRCTPETIGGFSAVAYYFGRELQRMRNVPVGLIHTSWGGTPSESWTALDELQKLEVAAPLLKRWDGLIAAYPAARQKYDRELADWQKAAEAAKAAGAEEPRRPAEPMGPHHTHRPATLYNAMIHPLLPYTIGGAIWYQGESNAGRAYQYRALFPTMIENWREDWNQGKFPFLFVQLANFEASQKAPYASEWAELREAQAMTLKLKNTGMAVTIDIGDPKDIHPKNKQEVGRRLALLAQTVAYGEKDILSNGPQFKKARFKDGKAVLRFVHTGGGLAAKDGPLTGFGIAGADQKFVDADAVIEGDTVRVSSPQVPKPIAVRYAWADNPACNLCNGAGLPASPFRTDDWPGLTIDAR